MEAWLSIGAGCSCIYILMGYKMWFGVDMGEQDEQSLETRISEESIHSLVVCVLHWGQDGVQCILIYSVWMK